MQGCGGGEPFSANFSNRKRQGKSFNPNVSCESFAT